MIIKLAKPIYFTVRPSDTKNASRGDGFRCVIRCALRRYFPGQKVLVETGWCGAGTIIVTKKGGGKSLYTIPYKVAQMARHWDTGAKWTDKPVQIKVIHAQL